MATNNVGAGANDGRQSTQPPPPPITVPTIEELADACNSAKTVGEVPWIDLDDVAVATMLTAHDGFDGEIHDITPIGFRNFQRNHRSAYFRNASTSMLLNIPAFMGWLTRVAPSQAISNGAAQTTQLLLLALAREYWAEDSEGTQRRCDRALEALYDHVSTHRSGGVPWPRNSQQDAAEYLEELLRQLKNEMEG